MVYFPNKLRRTDLRGAFQFFRFDFLVSLILTQDRTRWSGQRRSSRTRPGPSSLRRSLSAESSHACPKVDLQLLHTPESSTETNEARNRTEECRSETAVENPYFRAHIKTLDCQSTICSSTQMQQHICARHTNAHHTHKWRVS